MLTVYKYAKGEEIIPTIKNDNIIGIILDGFAQIINIEYNGNELVQENLGKDSVFGTTISATNSESCQIIAKEDTEVLIIDYSRLMRPENLTHNYFNIFLSNLYDIMSNKLLRNILETMHYKSGIVYNKYFGIFFCNYLA